MLQIDMIMLEELWGGIGKLSVYMVNLTMEPHINFTVADMSANSFTVRSL